MQVSLDGFMAGLEEQTDWMLWNRGSGVLHGTNHYKIFIPELTLSASHFIIGRQMAEEGFCYSIGNLQQRGKNEQGNFAAHLSDTPKTVISTTLTKIRGNPQGVGQMLRFVN